MQADEWQREGKLAQIVETLPGFIAQHPHDLTVRLRYAAVLAQMKNYSMALQQYRQILELDPNYIPAQIGIARVTSWKGDLSAGLGLYDSVLVNDPKNYEARVGKAFTLMWMKRDAESRKLFESASQEQPSDAEVAEALRKLRVRMK